MQVGGVSIVRGGQFDRRYRAYLRPQAERTRRKAVVGELVLDRGSRQMAQRATAPLPAHGAVIGLEHGSQYIGRRRRRAAIEIGMEPHRAVRQQDAIRKTEMMLAGANRAAMKRRDDRAAIIVVGGDIEDDSRRKRRQRQFLESAAPHRKR